MGTDPYDVPMTAPRRPSVIAPVAAAILLVGAALAGCAPSPDVPKPSPSTAAPTPAPTSTSTSTPAPVPSPADPSTDPEAPATFTDSVLAQICIDATRSAFDVDVEFDPAGTRVEQRTVTPEWLVLVPARTLGYEAESVCTIGGTPADPDIGTSSASIEPLPEEQIQRLIRGEDEGGE